MMDPFTELIAELKRDLHNLEDRETEPEQVSAQVNAQVNTEERANHNHSAKNNQPFNRFNAPPPVTVMTSADATAQLRSPNGAHAQTVAPTGAPETDGAPKQYEKRSENRTANETRVEQESERPVIWRDPADAATIRRQTAVIILQSIALVVVTAICFFLVRRVPDRIVIDRSSGRVIQINNREYGATEAVEMTPDNPGVPDRLYLAKTWCEWFFTIDRATRARQLERAFALMEPAGRRALARWLQERGELDTERAESWQAIWKVLDAQADRRDPYLIRILGEQQISRLTHQANISAGLQTFRRQISVTLKLVADPEGRADRNLRTGYLVAWVDARPVGTDEPVNANPTEGKMTDQEQKSAP